MRNERADSFFRQIAEGRRKYFLNGFLDRL